MTKHPLFLGLALCLLAAVSCKKSDIKVGITEQPKRLVEVWIKKGQADQSGFKFEYDDQGRIIKRSDALDPSNYEAWAYTGTAITNHKAYSKGVLVYDLNNSFSSANGSVFETFIHKDGSGNVTDTTILKYDVSGRHITYTGVIIKYASGRTTESGYVFNFVGDECASYHDQFAENGVINPFYTTVNFVERDSHLNPFYDMGPMNQILTSYADDWFSKGYYNPFNVVGPQIGADPAPGKFVWTYDADFMPVSMRAEGGSTALLTYVYSR